MKNGITWLGLLETVLVSPADCVVADLTAK